MIAWLVFRLLTRATSSSTSGSVSPGGDLVQEQHLRARRDSALPSSRRFRSGVAAVRPGPGLRGESHGGEDVERRARRGRSRAPGAEGRRGKHVLVDGEVRKRLRDLERANDAATRAQMRRQAVQLLALEANRCRRRA